MWSAPGARRALLPLVRRRGGARAATARVRVVRHAAGGGGALLSPLRTAGCCRSRGGCHGCPGAKTGCGGAGGSPGDGDAGVAGGRCERGSRSSRPALLRRLRRGCLAAGSLLPLVRCGRHRRFSRWAAASAGRPPVCGLWRTGRGVGRLLPSLRPAPGGPPAAARGCGQGERRARGRRVRGVRRAGWAGRLHVSAVHPNHAGVRGGGLTPSWRHRE